MIPLSPTLIIGGHRYPRTISFAPPAGVSLASRTGHLAPVEYRALSTRPEYPTADHAGRCEADPARCVNVVRQAGRSVTTMDRNGANPITREDI